MKNLIDLFAGLNGSFEDCASDLDNLCYLVSQLARVAELNVEVNFEKLFLEREKRGES